MPDLLDMYGRAIWRVHPGMLGELDRRIGAALANDPPDPRDVWKVLYALRCLVRGELWPNSPPVMATAPESVEPAMDRDRGVYLAGQHRTQLDMIERKLEALHDELLLGYFKPRNQPERT